jgi:hypothetical protein
MTRARLSLALAPLLFVGLITMPGTASAQAQPSHVFVAGNGSDRNPCTYARPCRTFQHAHDAVNSSGGVIDVLDPADYGPVSIIQSISILGHGWATVSTDSQHNTGISIDTANITVSIDGVRLEGVNFGGTGIALNVSANLFISNCVVRNFSNHGIVMKPPGPGPNQIVISNTVAASNGPQGIFLQPTAGSGEVTATFNRVEAYGNGQNGIAIYQNQAPNTFVGARIVDSVANDNGGYGFFAVGVPSQGEAALDVYRSTAEGNLGSYDVFAGDNSFVTVSECLISRWGQSQNGCLRSYGNNANGNGAAPCGTIGLK